MTPFHEIGRLPAPADNVAIATRRLEAGLEIELDDRTFSLSHTVLEGHRFAVCAIAPGEYLYSWGMPFGTATRPLVAGEYACNAGVLEALNGRDLDIELPAEPNFTDDIPDFEFDAMQFEPAPDPIIIDDALSFEGFDRGQRGVGTRNYIVVMAASSRASGFVRRLAAVCHDYTADFENIDGIVPVAHTEGDGDRLLNKELVIRTLAGFFVHPNVGAVLLVDVPGAPVNNTSVEAYLKAHHKTYTEVPHHFITLDGTLDQHLAASKNEVIGWLNEVNRNVRSTQPASHLNIALQCGGSDAFSGVSGNPLAAWVARAIVQRGGRANLAETDELIGAESYVLQRVRNEATAKRFVEVRDRFVEIAERHGSSAAGNPSGGNKFRGLYNIYLKSLGAAMKRHPEVRLDYVIDYGEPMRRPGYYFMDSPGNDLESIAGQVASGGNVIFFVTGNGSITNFPFVPTVKIVTTTRRYELLKRDMDVNAGAYLDGESMDALGEKMLATTLDIASGAKSAGESAGHAQVQLWRNWRIEEGETRQNYRGEVEQYGKPHVLPGVAPGPAMPLDLPRIGLILPTSLCSGQIAQMAVDRLNAGSLGNELGLDRFVSLVHTEGCGASSGPSEELFIRTMAGYLLHPTVRYAFLLEHGCEKTHNDYFSRYLKKNDIDVDRFGWASIQADGGIENVLHLIEDWFLRKQWRRSRYAARSSIVGRVHTRRSTGEGDYRGVGVSD